MFNIKINQIIAKIILLMFCIVYIFINPIKANSTILSPVAWSSDSNKIITQSKSNYEVFGFAPYWNINKLDNVDFSTLTTLAYFGVPVDPDGNLDIYDPGYQTFKSDQATELFKRAHSNGTRVVLTLIQMDSSNIDSFVNNPEAQNIAIDQAVGIVKNRGIDGVNIDFEYLGDPGQYKRDQFTQFVEKMTTKMHKEIPGSKVTVSVYASAVKDPKIYDISNLAKKSDGIFMMAYDYATASSESAMPTDPLYGYKEGKYWYDVSSAVEDFLNFMPANKLILGVPYYGYNYLVYKPGEKATTLPYYSWKGRPMAQTYTDAKDIGGNSGVDYITGWDKEGQVGWKAYFDYNTYTWRMIFLNDVRSLGIKYDFAKQKQLAGVGMWALGNDDGKQELWSLLREKFGIKYTATEVINRQINEII